MIYRTGFGYDVHRLAEDRQLVIGGVRIPFIKGAHGHSDADVLIHAICDALLGASNLHDIGFHFPDTSAEWKDISSAVLLKRVMEMVKGKGFKLGNLDTVVCLEAPKIAPYIPKMKKILADCMETDEDNISIKATTHEGIGFVGTGEGITAYAAVLLLKHL